MARKTGSISPRNKARISIALILILAVFAVFLDFPQLWDQSAGWINSKVPVQIPQFWNLSYKLGLDLQGGTHLVYKADVSEVPAGEKAEAVEGVRDVIERRVNAYGIAEPLVQTTKVGSEYRVIAELAGVKDVNQAIEMIGETPLLEFKEADDSPPILTEEQKQEMEEFNQEALTKAEEILAQVQAEPDKFGEIATEKSEDIVSKDNFGEVGYINETHPYKELLEPIKTITKGQIYGEVFESSEGYNILKRGESKEEKQVKANHILICYQGADRCEQDISKEDARKKIEELKSQATPENFIDLAKANSTEPGAETGGGDLGFFGPGQMVPEFEEAAFALEVGQISDIVETQFGFHLIYKTDEKTEDSQSIQVFRILLRKKTESHYIEGPRWKYTGLTGKHLKDAQVNFNQNTGESEISLEFNDEGKELFAQITERNLQKPIAIFLDGQSIVDSDGDGKITDNDVYAPVVQTVIKEGKASITGRSSLLEKKEVVRRLKSGALPVPIEIISQQTVGATLGHKSLTESLEAAILGLVLVALFMIVYYRLPGLISVISLIIYGILVLAILKLFGATLTLAGIAGFILSVGMAVDANVLIFERFKEELKLGKPLATAIDEGFKRAWPSIRDGNISTLITCVILFWFGTSVVKGFALTLFIGIMISMFSALVITKTILQIIIHWRFLSKLKWVFLNKKESNETNQ